MTPPCAKPVRQAASNIIKLHGAKGVSHFTMPYYREILYTQQLSCNGFAFLLQVAFDDDTKVAYLVGDETIYIIDLSNSILPIETGETPIGATSTGQQLPVVATKEVPATITDVQFCDKYVAISAENVNGKTLPGQVLIYSRFLRQGGSDSFKLLANFTVGEYIAGCHPPWLLGCFVWLGSKHQHSLHVMCDQH